MSTVTDRIKERIDLIDLIREYVPELKKAGLSWKARCPFHQEKTPSFVVSPEKGIWHCFGCHEGGDIFAFVKRAEGIEFPDALRLLAKRAGVKLEATDRREESERSRMLDILQLTSRWYHEALLKAKSADVAREYIQKRGLSEKTVADWQLGFSPDAWDTLLKYLESRGWREKEIAAAGLAVANDRGGYYDRFRYRLIFPITDVHGAVVGFTARKLREEDLGGKYINTPETAVYHKSQVLYGLSKAKAEIRKQDLAVVVEGNMDCLSAHQAGFTNVVASSGTALAPEQAKLLKRFTKNIVLAFDPDAAGQTALVRGLEVAWQEDMIVRMASLPVGLDPDALIKQRPGEWRELIATAPSFMDWLFSKTAKANDLTSALGKKQAGRALLPWIARLPDAIEQTHYLQILSGKIKVGEDVLREVIERSRHKPGAKRPGSQNSGQAATKDRPNVLLSIATRLAALVLLLPDKASFWSDFSFDWLVNSELASLYKNLKFFYDSHTPESPESKDSWLSQLPLDLQPWGRAAALLADELGANPDKDQIQSEIIILCNRLRSHFIQTRLKTLREQIQTAEAAGADADISRYLAEWQEWSQALPKTANYY